MVDVVDLFSGAGGMSYGFAAHPAFTMVGAADAQIGKPSTGEGRLDCNRTYAANMGYAPVEANLARVDPADLRRSMGLTGSPPVLLSCAPCTGLTRANPNNHLRDDARNSLVARTALFAEEFQPDVVVMENARELVMGNHRHHLATLRDRLGALGYRVRADVHFLNHFGLAQRRERALVVAVRGDLPLHGLGDLWAGRRVDVKATHVRRAVWDLPPVEAGVAHPDDPAHVSPRLGEVTRRRMEAIPADGGGWIDLIDRPDAASLLTPGMQRRAAVGDFGSHPDVYGRLWWDRPAATVKRECGHVGNGRYAHPEQHRLCTVRELAILSGFPRDYRFVGSLANMYRHIGDAVPPLISHQLAALTHWILTGQRPDVEQLILPNTHLRPEDIEAVA